MKVLVIHCSYQVKGGEDTVVEEEIKLMKSLGISVELLQFDNTKKALLKFILLPFNIFSFIKTKKKIQQFKPDVVHIHNLHYAASASVMYAVKKYSIPVVATLHNYRLICPSAILYFDHKPFFNSLKQKFPWAAIKRGVYRNSIVLTFLVSVSMQLHKWLGTWNYCNRFIVLSEDAKKIFQQSYIGLNKNKIVIKPNFLADDFIKHSEKANYFFYAGRLSEEKGINVLLDAFSQCDYTLKIAGTGELQQKVIDYSQRFSNIHFLGNLNKLDVLTYMQSSTALVFPSVWLEGMPLTIIESFACGTPVIASKIGVMRNMITDRYNGMFFNTGDAKALIKTLHEWQNFSFNIKGIYAKNARETYETNYSAEANAVQLLKIYNEAIHSNRLFDAQKNVTVNIVAKENVV